MQIRTKYLKTVVFRLVFLSLFDFCLLLFVCCSVFECVGCSPFAGWQRYNDEGRFVAIHIRHNAASLYGYVVRNDNELYVRIEQIYKIRTAKYTNHTI
ncbi:MAG: hypothetical protein EXX96DRAFT_234626 [Benjaminiella poitrasii]|nr:MAG: hypothetical protein EXX96DRAFT_234626 [Benjaminiella poitrasii]